MKKDLDEVGKSIRREKLRKSLQYQMDIVAFTVVVIIAIALIIIFTDKTTWINSVS